MSRKIYLLMFLLIFVASDTALGGRRCRCRHARRTCCPEKVCLVPEPSLGAHFCLKQVYMDFPSGPDMYYCLAYDLGCPNDNEYEDLWYGYRTTSLPFPQSCDACEFDPYRAHKGPRGHIKGHEDPSAPHPHPSFTNKGLACKWLKDNYPPYQSGGHPGVQCKYIKISHSSLSKVYYAVVVPAHGGGVDYFGVETKSLPNPIEETPTVTYAKVHGDVLYFKYNGGSKKALIWLR